jgi:hypothetical protein
LIVHSGLSILDCPCLIVHSGLSILDCPFFVLSVFSNVYHKASVWFANEWFVLLQFAIFGNMTLMITEYYYFEYWKRGELKVQYYSVMDLHVIKLSWYLIHVELTVANENIISVAS